VKPLMTSAPRMWQRDGDGNRHREGRSGGKHCRCGMTLYIILPSRTGVLLGIYSRPGLYAAVAQRHTAGAADLAKLEPIPPILLIREFPRLNLHRD
jgi:hypothetical protein